jgi:hypothetical protein
MFRTDVVIAQPGGLILSLTDGAAELVAQMELCRSVGLGQALQVAREATLDGSDVDATRLEGKRHDAALLGQ